MKHISFALLICMACSTEYALPIVPFEGTYINKDVELTFNSGHYILTRYNSEGARLGMVFGAYSVQTSDYEASKLTLYREYQISYTDKCPIQVYNYSQTTYKFSVSETVLYVEGFLYETFSRK